MTDHPDYPDGRNRPRRVQAPAAAAQVAAPQRHPLGRLRTRRRDRAAHHHRPIPPGRAGPRRPDHRRRKPRGPPQADPAPSTPSAPRRPRPTATGPSPPSSPPISVPPRAPAADAPKRRARTGPPASSHPPTDTVDTDDAARRINDLFAEMNFDPELADPAPDTGEREIRLRACPYRDVARGPPRRGLRHPPRTPAGRTHPARQPTHHGAAGAVRQTTPLPGLPDPRPPIRGRNNDHPGRNLSDAGNRTGHRRSRRVLWPMNRHAQVGRCGCAGRGGHRKYSPTSAMHRPDPSTPESGNSPTPWPRRTRSSLTVAKSSPPLARSTANSSLASTGNTERSPAEPEPRRTHLRATQTRRSKHVPRTSYPRRGHASVRSTDPYLHADITIKEKALALTTPTDARPGRYRPADKMPRGPGGPVTMPTTGDPDARASTGRRTALGIVAASA